MSQELVIQVLKKKNWVNSNFISSKLNLSRSAINTSLRALFRYNEIEKRESREMREIIMKGKKIVMPVRILEYKLKGGF